MTFARSPEGDDVLAFRVWLVGEDIVERRSAGS
jgi:hypothetical protein